MSVKKKRQMIKRYASHYILIPDCGFLKQAVAETSAGTIRLFPLEGETEDVEWLPGILVCAGEEVSSDDLSDMCRKADGHVLPSLPASWNHGNVLPPATPSSMQLYHFYPFDFTAMMPVAGTRRRRLM